MQFNFHPSDFRLLEMRKEKKLSQTEVAKALGIIQQQYARYEGGANEIPLRYFIALAQFYGVSLDYLAGLTDER